ncbi:MAG: DUF2161 family putative PD-(D/E)XK-type phosphodiesterase [Clostridiales bacterium]|jgi:hypothetical protein|nr:DUF2161 family putative PD-(D/E)XK-type phosphodiesterase [Clostridiales bacterium]
MIETDLYEPVKTYFSKLGYSSWGEVKGYDMAAQKGDELVAVELKLHFNTKLVFQAMERQKSADKVYMAIPRPKRIGKEARSMIELASRLGLGLLFVALDSEYKLVEPAVEPDPEFHVARRNLKKRRAVLKEAAGRSGDYNMGGSSKKKLNTAYREKALRVALALEKEGASSAPALIKNCGCDKQTYGILSRNFYGWFERTGEKPVFCLSQEGKKQLEESAGDELLAKIREDMAKHGNPEEMADQGDPEDQDKPEDQA